MMLRNLASMSAMRAVSALLTLALVASISRQWGLVPLGQFALLLTLFLFFQLLPLFGLHLYLIREVAAAPDSAADHAPNAALVAGAGAVMLCLLLGLGGGRLYGEQPLLALPLWLVGLALLPTAPIAVAESLLLAQERMGVVAKVNVVESLARTAASLLLVHAGHGLDAVFAVFLACRIGAAAAYLARRDLPALWDSQRVSAARLRCYAGELPTYLGIVLAAALVTRLDVLLLSRLASPEELGLYAAPAKLYELGQMVPQIVTVVMYPRLVALQQRRSADVAPLAAGGAAVPLLLGLPIVILLAWQASATLWLFGRQVEQAAPVLVLLLAALTVTGVNQLLAACMLVNGRADLDLRTLVAAGAFEAVALGLAVPAHGAVGAAAVVLMTNFAIAALRLLLLRKLLALQPFVAAIAGAAVPAAAMLLALSWAGAWHPAAAAALGLAVYAALAALVVRARSGPWRAFARLFGEARAA